MFGAAAVVQPRLRLSAHPSPAAQQRRASRLLARVASPQEKSELAPSSEAAVWAHASRAVLVQGFHWCSCERAAEEAESWYSFLLRHSDVLAEQLGATHVWLPPPSTSVAPQGYLPQDWYNLNSAYGTYDELVDLVEALRSRGVASLADIVVNHRCADAQDASGVWNVFSNRSFPDGEGAWGAWAIAGNDGVFHGEGEPNSGQSLYDAAPDLDHTNDRVRSAVKRWLAWLREEIGFEGFRFDYVKGFGAAFVGEYVSEAKGRLNVAEHWPEAAWEEGGVLAADQDAMRQSTCDWLDAAGGGVHAFDFTTKAILQEAVHRGEFWRLRDASGKPPGLIGWWPERSVTFIDNHDTGGQMADNETRYGQGHWRFPPTHRGLGYAYIFTHSGVPSVFSPHLLNDRRSSEAALQGELAAEVCALARARREAGIGAGSPVRIVEAAADVYVAVCTGDRRELLCKLGPRYDVSAALEATGGGWELATSGQDYAVFSRPIPLET
mmetsp:Transcript_15499/g.50958  ORF Transcript_15499/g.50958 Transcript_15499/m.50958 type:complete len:495 (-) Transcript_15499:35-1519(-)